MQLVINCYIQMWFVICIYLHTIVLYQASLLTLLDSIASDYGDIDNYDYLEHDRYYDKGNGDSFHEENYRNYMFLERQL